MIKKFKKSLPEHGLKQGNIGIKISENFAARRDGQLLLWMTCNLICRLEEIIESVEICIPQDIRVSMPAYIPFSCASSSNLKMSLSGVLAHCSRNCRITFVEGDFQSKPDAIILVGHDTTTNIKSKFVKTVACDGWLAYVGTKERIPNEYACSDNNPFGAFAAACITVGEIFKFLGGLNSEKGDMIDSFCFSTYDLSDHDLSRGSLKILEQLKNPQLAQQIELGQLHICGCGAVAHSFCQALFAIKTLRGDLFFIDRKQDANHMNETIDKTNLARYIMANNYDINKQKAELLSKRMSQTGVSVGCSDESFEMYVNNNNVAFSHIVSCVDNSHARHSIQEQIPQLIHGGSTTDLTSQISVYDLSSDTQCLKCYNPKNESSDYEITERLKKMSPLKRKKEAIKRGVDPEKLERYLEVPTCGSLDGKSIQYFSNLSSHPDFSVNFVSALSGILLAAEIVKNKNPSLLSVLNCKPATDLHYAFWTNKCILTPSKSKSSCWCNSGNTTPRDIHRKLYGSNPNFILD